MTDNTTAPVMYYLILVPIDEEHSVEFDRAFDFADIEAKIHRAIDAGYSQSYISVARILQKGTSPSDEDEMMGSFSGESWLIDENQDDSARWATNED